ncbi:hypothetical protein [Maritimibacter sp. DP1N21-5]|uniref:hypothetical protein n=1 Tax=Maritimibacter sp. DP1N21-5 TaxID=2836867 RepID=UPI001C440B96|nr:hypothetical protein [Maritimibacter sp. DP1N21-5]MBV7409830.1 hypothetical protein [Maritimibacter sp. DP1N21-5]
MVEVRRNSAALKAPTAVKPRTAGLRVLAIGPAHHHPGDGVAVIPDTRFLSFSELCPDVLAQFEPDVVISPLVTSQFDCLEVAHRLAQAGYRGRYRALTPQLPRPEMVRREVRASFPDIDFDVVLVGSGAFSMAS